MRTFLDFVHTEKANHPQFMLSIQKEDPNLLQNWFQTIGYDVSTWECSKVIETFKTTASHKTKDARTSNIH
ncbi:hypothetical protein [Leptospira andrefontaineae]|uniref:Uncharacterized protein n=1 Tax=Leptospira andrefontaineae TaxID=2484976 RepID=A0A4R9GYD3_9LEPT|nr:hypothetical protein [Leptospira andrefontaineae]TGK35821.1 hypothetical protein EHO65_19505 [Leptospira andrefontaineae]